jgi:hypothetical protein
MINFIKAITFTRVIKAGGRLREFNFRKFKNEGQDLFSVDTVDDRGDRILFRMQRSDNNHWSITQTVAPTWIPPTWIQENESLMDEAIETELHNA